MWTLATRWARWNRPAADLELAGTNAESIGVPVQNEIF
jgi:hypothetical protein